MMNTFKKVAKEYITYSTGQVNYLFPRADSWLLYKLTKNHKYNNAFPPFQKNKNILFDFILSNSKIKEDVIVTSLYLVKHTERSFQPPVSEKLHGYIPVTPMELLISERDLSLYQGIDSFDLYNFKEKKMYYKKDLQRIICFTKNWHTLPYVKEGDVYFYVEFGR